MKYDNNFAAENESNDYGTILGATLPSTSLGVVAEATARDNLLMTPTSHVVNADIVIDPAIHAGEPIIAGTSTPVRAIAELWNQGLAAEEIILRLQHLQLVQVFAALHYYLSHGPEIDRLIDANQIPEDWAGKRFNPATGRVE